MIYAVAVWSGVNVAGVRLMDLNPAIGTDKDPERWSDIHRKVIDRYHSGVSVCLFGMASRCACLPAWSLKSASSVSTRIDTFINLYFLLF